MKRKGEVIQSGHFMISSVTEDQDDHEDISHDRDSPVLHEERLQLKQKKEKYDFSHANKETRDTYHFPRQAVEIDASLSRLFRCMSLAYNGGRVVSPKWKNFKGLKLSVKDKIRLNNAIWRTWHIQYIKRNRPLIQFATPLENEGDNDNHSKPEAVVLEGKYWKRRIETVVEEYKKWRAFYTTVNVKMSENLREGGYVFMPSSDIHHHSPTKDIDSMLIDSEFPSTMNDLTADTLFSSLGGQPFHFPDSREIHAMKNTNSDMIQPGLLQLQPALDDMDFPPLDLNDWAINPPAKKMALSVNNQTQRMQSSSPEEVCMNQNFQVEPSPFFMNQVNNLNNNSKFLPTDPLLSSIQCASTSGKIFKQPSTSTKVVSMGSHSDQRYPQNFNASNQIAVKSRQNPPDSTHFTYSNESLQQNLQVNDPQFRQQQPMQVMQQPSKNRNALVSYHRGGAHHNPSAAGHAVFAAAGVKTTANLQHPQLHPQLLPQQHLPSQQQNKFTHRVVGNKIGVTPQIMQSTNQQSQSNNNSNQQQQQIIISSSNNHNIPAQSQQQQHLTVLAPVMTVHSQNRNENNDARRIKHLLTSSSLTSNVKIRPNPKQQQQRRKQKIVVESIPMTQVAVKPPPSCSSSWTTTWSPQSLNSTPSSGVPPSYAESMVVSSDQSTIGGTSPISDKDISSCSNSKLRSGSFSAEQKRRLNIKVAFDKLQTIIPGIHTQPNSKISKASIMAKATNYIKMLQNDRMRMDEERQQLRNEVNLLKGSIQNLQQQLPDTGVPVTQPRSEDVSKKFNLWVKERSQRNWKFYLFGPVIKPWFESYHQSVSAAGNNTFAQFIHQWTDEKCSLPQLRANVINSLQVLSCNTSVLTNPAQLQTQVENIVTSNDDIVT